ncbi:flagellar hook capping FlgD N-terminal domain-containing protein [Yoonia sp.]|uniref:flagellar hook capping FlgD N-terminal domain-containing protein n=1 Tax=Yoonia sp. TaxID=2212373 RepID=UPI0035C81D0B
MEIGTNTLAGNDALGSATAPTLGDATSKTSQLSSDFEVFLKMLTGQMQYQDPLNPVDSTDYATQLATFSGVEQAVKTNELLDNLTSQMAIGGLTDLAPWVGREARSDAAVFFDSEPIEIFPKTMGLADSTEIVVRNAAGEEVQRMPYVAGSGPIIWAGVAPDGSPLPPGMYNLSSVGISNGEVIGEVAVETYSRVTEVRIADGKPVVVLQGGIVVPGTEITALRDGTG